MANTHNKTILIILILAVLIAMSAILINRRSALAPTDTQISMVNKTWQLNSYFDEDTEAMVDVLENSEVTLEFDENNRVGGSGGCNSYSAEYKITEETLKVEEIESTLIACEETGNQEAKFLSLLAKSKYIDVTEENLVLKDEDKKTVLEFSRTDD